NKRRAARNARVRTNVKALLKKSRELSTSGSADFKATAIKMQQAIDKAVKTGVIHRNAAARKKSAIMKKANAKKA
ncbi:30S ribosomal protein S20, partial [Patescibacteria group bacterium]|nr:30S ribosomal protein S20 [Patescibacteria group bacterium]